MHLSTSRRAAIAVSGTVIVAALFCFPFSCRDHDDGVRRSREATPRRDGFRSAELERPPCELALELAARLEVGAIVPIPLPVTLEPGDRAFVVCREGANVVVAIARGDEALIAPRGYGDRDAWYVAAHDSPCEIRADAVAPESPQGATVAFVDLSKARRAD